MPKQILSLIKTQVSNSGRCWQEKNLQSSYIHWNQLGKKEKIHTHITKSFLPAGILSKWPPKTLVNDETVGGEWWTRSSDWRFELNWCKSITAARSQSSQRKNRAAGKNISRDKKRNTTEDEVKVCMDGMIQEVSVDSQESFWKCALRDLLGPWSYRSSPKINYAVFIVLSSVSMKSCRSLMLQRQR